MQDFFNPYSAIRIHGSTLPHWQQGSAYVFTTWRLADSLPLDLLREWKAEREVWMAQHPSPWSQGVWDQYNELFPERMESWLDRGMGSCLLRQAALRRIVCLALRFFDGDRYTVAGFVVMPNHVHIVFQPMQGYLIEEILHSWKSYTSKELNKLTGARGELWQRGYWDRLIRSRAHFEHCLRYMRENPSVARLPAGDYTIFER
ncbi:transposase [Coraliomargarita sp. SDUM461003]|uniref:Transposase n=1 Tax=Thalassobacterium maritimum TaxID=3041265 RepID=A0ABU1AS62_9BACT|nr:transposase [Coraliomargarita sp. SDUM461003]MDQ8206993.1 transposase [Coraliomargarita sp. SDUM461003]